MNILLVNLNTGKQSREYQVPLALRKLYTYYASQGHIVEFIDHGQMPKLEPDIICFSSIFLFKLEKDISYIAMYRKLFFNSLIRIGGIAVSLRKDLFEHRLGTTNIDYVIGLQEDIEQCRPEYNVIPSQYSYGFSSRGCPNRCPWCVVPKLEGKIRIVANWQNNMGDHQIFRLMDNNILACSIDHIEAVLSEVAERGKIIDFNQGLDCVLFAQNQDKLFNLFERYRKNIIFRFAWDSQRQDKYIPPTLEALKALKKTAVWYVLYGFKDSNETIHHRMHTLLEANHNIKIMRYRDCETGQYRDDPSGFDDKLRLYIRHRYITGIIAGMNREDTRLLFPKEFSAFEKMLNIFYEFTLSLDSSKPCITASTQDLYKMVSILKGECTDYFKLFVPVEKSKVAINYEDDW